MNRGFKGAFLLAGLLGAGCSSSSSTTNSDGVAEAFMGRWEIEGASSSFALTCPNFGMGMVPIWTELDLDHGVLSDLTDISNACVAPGMSFDVDKGATTATVVNPDPYTGNAPLCRYVLGSDSNGNPAYIDFAFSDLTITKLQASSSSKAPRVLLAGSATGPLMQDDGTNMGNTIQTDTCTIMGTGDVFHRTTQP
jgi:hypothetical protein